MMSGPTLRGHHASGARLALSPADPRCYRPRLAVRRTTRDAQRGSNQGTRASHHGPCPNTVIGRVAAMGGVSFIPEHLRWNWEQESESGEWNWRLELATGIGTGSWELETETGTVNWKLELETETENWELPPPSS